MYQIKASDPSVASHLSGKEFARLLADELGEPALFGENVAVSEQLETQKVVTEAQVEYEADQEEKIEEGSQELEMVAEEAPEEPIE